MLHIKQLKQDQSGISLIETIVALALLFIASTASVGLFVQAAEFTGTAKHYTEAAYAARAAMEEIESTDFDDITTNFPDYTLNTFDDTSLPDGAMWFVTYPNGVSADPLEVLTLVFWPEDGATKYTYLMTKVVSL